METVINDHQESGFAYNEEISTITQKGKTVKCPMNYSDVEAGTMIAYVRSNFSDSLYRAYKYGKKSPSKAQWFWIHKLAHDFAIGSYMDGCPFELEYPVNR